MTRIDIPTDWTGEQAIAIVDWLQSVVDAIWGEYGDELVEQLVGRPVPLDECQADLPF